MRRSHRHHRRDGQHSRSGANSHPQFLVLSADERTISVQEGDYEQATAVVSGRPLGTLVEQERTRGLEGASSPSLRFSTPADSTGRSNDRYFLHPMILCLCTSLRYHWMRVLIVYYGLSGFLGFNLHLWIKIEQDHPIYNQSLTICDLVCSQLQWSTLLSPNTTH